MDAVGFGDDGLEGKVWGDREFGGEVSEHLGVGGGEGVFSVEEDVDAPESSGVGSRLNMQGRVIRGGEKRTLSWYPDNDRTARPILVFLVHRIRERRRGRACQGRNLRGKS